MVWIRSLEECFVRNYFNLHPILNTDDIWTNSGCSKCSVDLLDTSSWLHLAFQVWIESNSILSFLPPTYPGVTRGITTRGNVPGVKKLGREYVPDGENTRGDMSRVTKMMRGDMSIHCLKHFNIGAVNLKTYFILLLLENILLCFILKTFSTYWTYFII